jgi:hypothetical protein
VEYSGLSFTKKKNYVEYKVIFDPFKEVMWQVPEKLVMPNENNSRVSLTFGMEG